MLKSFTNLLIFNFSQLTKQSSNINLHLNNPNPSEQTQTQLIRLSKYLSLKSLCSRRQAQQLIQLGLVRVDGKRIFQNMLIPYESKMKAFTDIGIKQQKPITKLWMVNKPRQFICTRSDTHKRKTVYELFSKDVFQNYGHLMTIGRLDYNSEGLILVTNDSVLKEYLENPLNDFQRRYHVKVHGRVTQNKMQKMNSPVIINGEQYGPLKAKIMRQLSTNVWLDVMLKTGKNRQVRKIMQKCDLQVSKLIRVDYGPFSLKNLQHSQIKQLQIPAYIQRKLKKQKVRKLTGGSNALVQIDMRQKALQFAKRQKQSIKPINSNNEEKKLFHKK